ncbi:D-ribose pyranase [Bifidobacterium cuniculi]|uniref:D-ribose pyranase n=1 Tax=Bifidobacterium cuniculi TaxID=1688 RepID=A0A087ADS4_9BIFI|nr:D-ribose pyranase [Bifidobacterium cuniculi]KFI56924.1 RbsD/FucU transport family protein [Bifidobacterium cuniculi]
MLTSGIINRQLAAALADLRHKDRFVVSDAGLPVPEGVQVIDLALDYGVLRFTQVLDVLAPVLVLEQGIMAKEAKGQEPETWVHGRFPDVPLFYVPHDGKGGFKSLEHGVKFVIRTGETTPYANVIFRCGVPF